MRHRWFDDPNVLSTWIIQNWSYLLTHLLLRHSHLLLRIAHLSWMTHLLLRIAHLLLLWVAHLSWLTHVAHLCWVNHLLLRILPWHTHRLLLWITNWLHWLLNMLLLLGWCFTHKKELFGNMFLTPIRIPTSIMIGFSRNQTPLSFSYSTPERTGSVILETLRLMPIWHLFAFKL